MRYLQVGKCIIRHAGVGEKSDFAILVAKKKSRGKIFHSKRVIVVVEVEVSKSIVLATFFIFFSARNESLESIFTLFAFNSFKS
jgi:hypothetical protein